MAFTKIALTKGTDVKYSPVGFSFTTFFFGFWVPLLRGDWRSFAVMFACWLFSFTIPVIGLIIYLFAYCVFPAVYNRHRIATLLADGYIMADIDASNLQRYGLNQVNLLPPRGDEMQGILISFVMFVLFLLAFGKVALSAASMAAGLPV